MRDRVTIAFGRKEYPLLPTFGVMDEFEDRCGALTSHLLSLTSGTATLRNRATLVFLGMKEARTADGDSASAMSIQSTMQAMWEIGAADNDLLLKEVEFIERLLYTPEQYRAKKEARERAEEALKAMDILQAASPNFSDSLRPFSGGNQASSGEQPLGSSSPA